MVRSSSLQHDKRVESVNSRIDSHSAKKSHDLTNFEAMLMLPHNSGDFGSFHGKTDNDEITGIKRPRETTGKDDLALSEGVQSFGRNFSIPEINENPSKRMKKEAD